MDILGLIPARGGSKGIVGKNIVSLGGKPLLAYTHEAASASTKLTRTILSTDDAVIADTGRVLGMDVPFLRPVEYAGDGSGATEVIMHALDTLAANGYLPEVVVYLQPTSPLRTGVQIDEAVDLLLSTGADTVVSVMDVPHALVPSSQMLMDSEYRLVRYADGPLRRQEKERTVARNGPAILVLRVSALRERGDFYGGDTRAYEMDRASSVDIDDPIDLVIAKAILNARAGGAQV